MKTFPTLNGQTPEFYEYRKTNKPYPRSVPWTLVEGHEEQAQINHGQTLTRLAERGGLSPLELWCVVNGSKWHKKGDMTETKAIDWLRTLEGVEWE